jgi:hypothetical protein
VVPLGLLALADQGPAAVGHHLGQGPPVPLGPPLEPGHIEFHPLQRVRAGGRLHQGAGRQQRDGGLRGGAPGGIDCQQPLQRRRRPPLGQIQQWERPGRVRRNHRHPARGGEDERLLGQPPARCSRRRVSLLMTFELPDLF